jgi:MFS family permease
MSAFRRLATGGDWAMAQSPATRRNLIWFWLDGFFASASDNITVTYLVVYLLALGATQAQIGLMSSISSLTTAALLLPGAMLVERYGGRRNIVLFGGGLGRLALLWIAMMPLFVQPPAPILIYLVIALSILRDGLTNLTLPAWMSLTGDIVPMQGRGRFFASRNFIMGVSGISMTLLAGLVITRLTQPAGYQVALLAALGIGLFSWISFSRINDQVGTAASKPAAPAAGASETEPLDADRPQKLALREMLREMLAQPEFVRWAAVTALWNFSLNIAGPFFNVYLVQNLHADAAMVGITAIASSVATMLAQRKLGDLNDRWGARRLTMISGLLIPIVPLLWVFINSAWYVIPINLLSGVLWGAYSLASFNYLLQLVPRERMARFSALFQIIVTVSLGIGAAVGSLVVTQFGFQGVFTLSSIGRLLAALLFVWLIRNPRRAPALPTAK